jgi:hypothetical protein
LRLVVSSKGRDVLLGRRGEVLSRCGLERGLENPNLSLREDHHHNFQIPRTMLSKELPNVYYDSVLFKISFKLLQILAKLSLMRKVVVVLAVKIELGTSDADANSLLWPEAYIVNTL